MKTDFLKALGIEQSVIDKIMAENGKDIERHKKQVEDLTGERDTLKEQIDGFTKKLNAFEGVDIDGLRGEIEALKGDIAAKEADFKSQLADRDFQSAISSAITAAKGKNPKAIMALLDHDALKVSKNQKADITAAIKAVSESDSYLFEGSKKIEGASRPTVSTGWAHNEEGAKSQSASAVMNSVIRGAVTEGE